MSELEKLFENPPITQVTKKGGYLANVDMSKITEEAKGACKDLEHVNYEELIIDAHISWKEGMTTSELQEVLIKTAINKISAERSSWTFVAARLTLRRMYHDVGRLYGNKKGKRYPSLEQYIKVAMSTGKYHKSFWKKFDLELLNKQIDETRDLQFNYLGIKTYLDRYAICNMKGALVELPQHMFMGIAMFLAQKEDDCNKWAIIFYNKISKFNVMLATPTLSNARLNRHQLSSCFVGGHSDSLSDIFRGYDTKATISKYGGGIGWDWTQTRASGGDIDGYIGVAKGTTSFLKIDNDIAIAVDQLGVRKGSFAPYMQDWHMDIFEFLKLKEAGGEDRKRARDLNLALWMSDEFMRRESENKDWTLFDPAEVPHLNELHGDAFTVAYLKAEKDPTLRKRVVPARLIFGEAMRLAFKFGMPFIGFKDAVNKGNMNSNTGIIRCSNLCTEILQVTEPSKDIIKITFNDNEKREYLEKTRLKSVKAKDIELGDIIDGKIVTKKESSFTKERMAICNLGSVHLAKYVKSALAERKDTIFTMIRMLDNVIDNNLYTKDSIRDTAFATRAIGMGVMGEMEALADAKIYFGSEEHLLWIDEVYSEIRKFAEEASQTLAKEKGVFPEYSMSDWEKPMRNAYLMAIAPTSSIAIFVGTTNCIEPVFDRFWYEENMEGIVPMTAPGLNVENYAYYQSAYDIPFEKQAVAVATRQKYIDQGQSFNIHIRPDDIKEVSDMAKMYRYAWMLGIKTIYYVRSQAPEADNLVIDRKMECTGCQ